MSVTLVFLSCYATSTEWEVPSVTFTSLFGRSFWAFSSIKINYQEFDHFKNCLWNWFFPTHTDDDSPFHMEVWLIWIFQPCACYRKTGVPHSCFCECGFTLIGFLCVCLGVSDIIIARYHSVVLSTRVYAFRAGFPEELDDQIITRQSSCIQMSTAMPRCSNCNWVLATYIESFRMHDKNNQPHVDRCLW